MFCGRKNVTKLEKLQERALRFVFKDNNSSYADLLKRGNFLSLSAYRIRNLAMEVFKCFHGMNPMYLNNLFCKQEIKYNLRDKTLLEQPKFSTKTYGYRSFKYYGSKLWNALPFEINNTDNYDEFKLRLTTRCHSSDLDKLEIFWLIFSLFWLNCHCYPNGGVHVANMGPTWVLSAPAGPVLAPWTLLLGIVIITVIVTIITIIMMKAYSTS